MRKLKFFAISCLAISIIACGDETKTTEATNNQENIESVSQENYEGMEMVNLNEYDLPLQLYIADATNGKQEIIPTERGSIEILVGENFGIEIIPFGFTVAEKKADLANNLVYTIEYLEENANKIIYKQSITDSEIDEEYHFYYTTEIDGDLYAIKSLTNAYSKKEVEKMLSAAESLTGVNPV